jgi:phage terminase large subunit-like protein
LPCTGLHWDVEAAQRSIDYFAKVLKLNGGDFEGAPFVLLPWQCFIVGSIFGWKNARGFRRFRMVYVESGKDLENPLSAGIGLYCLTADKEPRAEVYAAATKKTRQWSSFVMRWRWSISLGSFRTHTEIWRRRKRVEPGFSSGWFILSPN